MDEKNEIRELKSRIKTQKIIIDQNKEYLFVLENELNQKNKLIKSLRNENKAIKSTFSWKITKPLRYLSKKLK